MDRCASGVTPGKAQADCHLLVLVAEPFASTETAERGSAVAKST